MSFSVRNPNSFKFSDLTANLKYLQPVAVGAGANASQAAAIVLNASGSALNAGASGFYVAPVRSSTESNMLFYNATSKEVSYGPLPPNPIPSGSSYADYLYWNPSTTSWVVGNTRINLGSNAGANNQGSFAVAVGINAGLSDQGANAVAIGNKAGQTSQGGSAVAIGNSAGQTFQQFDSVAIGVEAGMLNQSAECVAIGARAGKNTQSLNAVALGPDAGKDSQGTAGVAVGLNAGGLNQNANAVAIGNKAGQFTQGGNAIAIGDSAGQISQGGNAVAIGWLAGVTNQAANSIILNASGTAFNGTNAPGFFVNPVRAGLTGTGLVLSTDNEIGQTSSSLRYKENITDLQKDTSKILELKSKSFDLKSGAKNRFGYIAEEVFEIDPSLVIFNNENQPEALEEFHMFVCLVEEVKKLKARLDALETPAEAPAQ